MNLFEKMITTFSPAVQASIQKKIEDWSKKHPYGQRVAKNIYLEHFLPDSIMQDILSFIASDTSTSTKEFEVKYQMQCYKYTLQGGDVIWAIRPLLFGAAVEIDTFKKHLMDNYPKSFPSEKKVDDFIVNLKSGNLSRLRKKIMLKKYSVWTTWNESDHSGVPFEFCNTVLADEIRANMGLNKLTVSKELILFVYSIPSKIEVKRPTITDAELSQYFEPPVPTFTKHGLTRTWELENTMASYNLNPRPEGIHKGIELSNLILPLITRW